MPLPSDELMREPEGDAATDAGRCADPAQVAARRSQAAVMSLNVDLSRLRDDECATLRLRVPAHDLDDAVGAAPRLLPMAPPPAPPAAPPPPPPAARRSAPAAPVAAPIGTFTPALDVAAMVAVLRQAARDGVPFCEECARAAAERAGASA